MFCITIVIIVMVMIHYLIFYAPCLLLPSLAHRLTASFKQVFGSLINFKVKHALDIKVKLRQDWFE